MLSDRWMLQYHSIHNGTPVVCLFKYDTPSCTNRKRYGQIKWFKFQYVFIDSIMDDFPYNNMFKDDFELDTEDKI